MGCRWICPLEQSLKSRHTIIWAILKPKYMVARNYQDSHRRKECRGLFRWHISRSQILDITSPLFPFADQLAHLEIKQSLTLDKRLALSSLEKCLPFFSFIINWVINLFTGPDPICFLCSTFVNKKIINLFSQ